MLKRQICLVFSSEQSNFHDFFAKKPHKEKVWKLFLLTGKIQLTYSTKLYLFYNDILMCDNFKHF